MCANDFAAGGYSTLLPLGAGIDNTQRDELYCVLYVFVFIMYYILYYFRICSLKNTPKIRLYYVLYCVLYVLCINTYFVLSDPA